MDRLYLVTDLGEGSGDPVPPHPQPPPPFILVKKGKRMKRQQGKQNKTGPPPPSVVQGLDPPLLCIVTNSYLIPDLTDIDLITDFYASSKYLIPDAVVF